MAMTSWFLLEMIFRGSIYVFSEASLSKSVDISSCCEGGIFNAGAGTMGSRVVSGHELATGLGQDIGLRWGLTFACDIAFGATRAAFAFAFAALTSGWFGS